MNDSLSPVSDCFGQAGARIPESVTPCAGFELPVMAVEPQGSGAELSGRSASIEQRRLAIVREAIRNGRPLHQLEAYFDWLDNVGVKPSR